ncbi:MAG: ureidoglycolate lyase [Gammaproteobacteria bacterium]|jgi:ureidoglycolate lyase|nr:ureidoglycolate lyase [Gammaproteobacteria bacterium]
MSAVPFIEVKPLTKAGFAPFGDVIETEGAEHFAINNGFTQRYHRLAAVTLAQAEDEAIVNIFVSRRWEHPIQLAMLEQHPLGSQAFIPMDKQPFIVVVAEKADNGSPNTLHAFVTNGQQGVNYAKGVWHHPLLILAPEQRFLVVDRSGEGNNLIEVDLCMALQAQIDLQTLIAEHIGA